MAEARSGAVHDAASVPARRNTVLLRGRCTEEPGAEALAALSRAQGRRRGQGSLCSGLLRVRAPSLDLPIHQPGAQPGNLPITPDAACMGKARGSRGPTCIALCPAPAHTSGNPVNAYEVTRDF